MLLLFALVSTVSFAQKTKDDGQELINRFFELYRTKGYEDAVKYTLSTNKWYPAKGDEMDDLIVKLEKEVKVMGKYLGHEQIRSRRLGQRFRIVSYLIYYQRDPIRFTFELYKNDRGWEISDFVFDTNFEAEIEASMKLTEGK